MYIPGTGTMGYPHKTFSHSNWAVLPHILVKFEARFLDTYARKRYNIYEDFASKYLEIHYEYT